ncbi:hypothetical protein PspLS_05553 [Pyricularia sp. CBS 133598]|nr:hypothetical protein PspLS_05553 [Pyricularia sp. CBS 133598]
MEAHVLRADFISGDTYGIDPESHLQDEAEVLHDRATMRMMALRLKRKNPKMQNYQREKDLITVVKGEAQARAETEAETATTADLVIAGAATDITIATVQDQCQHRQADSLVSSSSSSKDLDQDYRELFSSSAFNTAPWNSPSISFSLDSEDTESQTQQLRPNEVLPGVMSSPAIEIHDSKYTGNDLLQGPHHSKLSTFQDPKKQRQPLFCWL